MKTIEEVLKLSTAFLEERKVDRARRISEELIAHTLRIKRMDLYLQYDRPLIESELTTIRELLKKCSKNEPLSYLMGEIEFYRCQIKTDPRALIPRPETEILVDIIKKRVKTPAILWDLCTGSGCIGIALKKHLPDLQVTLSDLSQEALELAAENAKINKVEVELLHGDLLSPFHGRKAHIIACNPPYISENEFFSLDPSVKEFEPKMALVGGERGTEFYEKLQRELPQYLHPGAQIFFEIGYNQGEVVKEIFSREPWKGQTLLLDWSGHPRFFFLEFP